MMFPPDYWGEYQERRQSIAAMLDPRCYTIDHIDVLVLNGDARVFACDEAAIIVAVKKYPAGATELHGLAAAGALNAILRLIQKAEEWARGLGVTFACISSRQGWQRVLKTRGYSVNRVELRKDL